jgi:2-dehydro-3-deoxyglucarate aldolase/4-hydroxy-2-oxoheptanedioate aldolase
VAVGTIVTVPDPRIVEVVAGSGADWIFADCEHGAISTWELSKLLGVVPQSIPTVARIQSNEEIYVKQALDAGCSGIVCPQVNDASTARELVRWAKYPPLGSRSVGISRAHAYGRRFHDYVAEANSSTSVIVQIENIVGVENITSILEVEGVGGVFLGPYDLSGSMGKVGQVNAPEVVEKMVTVLRSCNDREIPVGGYFGSSAAFQAFSKSDMFDVVAVGIDLALLAQTALTLIADVKSVTSPPHP